MTAVLPRFIRFRLCPAENVGQARRCSFKSTGKEAATIYLQLKIKQCDLQFENNKVTNFRLPALAKNYVEPLHCVHRPVIFNLARERRLRSGQLARPRDIVFRFGDYGRFPFTKKTRKFRW